MTIFDAANHILFVVDADAFINVAVMIRID